MGKRIPGSWIFVGSVLLIMAVAYFGYNAYSKWRLSSFELKPIEPGQVNLVAVRPGQGYFITVSNRIAHLAQGNSSGMEANMGEGSLTNAKRLPIKELMKSLQGDEEALGVLIEKMNEISANDLPANQVLWPKEKLEKALDGDKALQGELIADLNVDLDGTPLDTIDLRAIIDGIVIVTPVPITYQIGDETRTLEGPVRIHYQPNLARAVEDEINKKFNPSSETVIGIYTDAAAKASEAKEDVADSIRRRMGSVRQQQLAAEPSRILANAMVLVNEEFVTGVTLDTYENNKGDTLSDITLNLTEEGRMRLWKYSYGRENFQLLFVVDGVAFAAPRITTPLAERKLTIRQLPDQILANEAFEKLESAVEGGA